MRLDGNLNLTGGGQVINFDCEDAAIANAKLATNPLARANHTGTQAASTISDLGDVILAAQLNWDLKDPVRVVVVDNVADLAAFTVASRDGQTLVEDDRVGLVGQTDASQNGLYVVGAVTAGEAELTRAADADVSAEVTTGLTFTALQGTTYGGTRWTLTTTGTITLGTTNLTFTQDPTAPVYTADETTLTKDGNEFSIKDGGVGTTQLADDGVTDEKLSSTFTKKFSGLIGDGAETDIVVTHNLGTRDVVVATYDASDYGELIPNSVERTSTNAVTVSFLVAPATDELRVVVIG